MGNPLRDWVERVLPWYDAVRERQRDAHTARVEQRSESARQRADRVVAEYRSAENASDEARKE